MPTRPVTQGSRRVRYVVDHLSRNVLADILLLRIKEELGDGNASDASIVEVLNEWANEALTMRKQKKVNLPKRLKEIVEIESNYADRERIESQTLETA